jgi:hypothetical protein
VVREQRLVVASVIILVVAGALLIALRVRNLHGSHLSRGESVWRLAYDIDFPLGVSKRTYIAIPDNTACSRVFRETFSHQGIWMDILLDTRKLARDAAIVPIVGREHAHFTAYFDIHVKAGTENGPVVPEPKPPAEEIAHYLRGESEVQSDSAAVSAAINQLKIEQTSKGGILAAIFDYCSETIVQQGIDAPSDAAGTLQRGLGTTLGRARAMTAMCRAAKIPARLVVGFVLDSTQNAQKHYWIEAYFNKNWLPYDPENGYAGELPASFLPIRRDGVNLVRTGDSTAYTGRYSIRRLPFSPALGVSPDNRIWSVFDLTKLPLGMQKVITVILLLPIGALVTAIIRNIVGIRTLGVFTPSLIALSFVQADWRTGTAVFFVVLGVGMAARLILNKFKLLMVARLGIILTLVILCMVAAVSILDYLGLTPSASAVLLPMVILTMMIERFNVTLEEDGCRQALTVFVGTLAVALCCFFVLRIDALGRLVLGFPEIHFFNLAALLLIGRYSGYRLAELWRFREFT